MTLIIAAHGTDDENNNYIILAADCRGVIQTADGIRSELNIMKKLAKLSEHVGILIAGNGHFGNYLVERFIEVSAENDIDGITDVAEEFGRFCQDCLRRSNDVPRIDFPQVTFIIVGFDKERSIYKIPKIYTLSSADGFILGRSPTPYEIQGKPFIALYKFAKEFEDNNNSVDRLSRFIAQCIFDTHEIDGDVGLPTWVARITSDGYNELTEEQARSLYQSWDMERLERAARE